MIAGIGVIAVAVVIVTIGRLVVMTVRGVMRVPKVHVTPAAEIGTEMRTEIHIAVTVVVVKAAAAVARDAAPRGARVAIGIARAAVAIEMNLAAKARVKPAAKADIVGVAADAMAIAM